MLRSLWGMNAEPTTRRPSNYEWPYPVKLYPRMGENSAGAQGLGAEPPEMKQKRHSVEQVIGRWCFVATGRGSDLAA